MFVETYGAHEQIVEAKEVTHEGVVTKMGKQISLKENLKSLLIYCRFYWI